jgi:hypothetical protein
MKLCALLLSVPVLGCADASLRTNDQIADMVAATKSASSLLERIGVATMLSDGTIRMLLSIRDRDRGIVGDAVVEYKLGEPDYDVVLKHLGELKPGEWKPVLPFPKSQ